MITKHAGQDAIHANYVTFRDGEITIGQVFEIETGSGLLFIAQAHDWEGDSTEYDPITVDVTDDVEQAQVAVTKRYASYLDYLRINGATITTTAEVAPEVEPAIKQGDRVTHAAHPGVWTLEHRRDDGSVALCPDDSAARDYLLDGSGFLVTTDELVPWVPPVAKVDPAMADDPALTPRMRNALRNLLDMEDSYAEMAPTTQAVRANAHTMTALETRKLVELVQAWAEMGEPKLRRYRLTAEGRGLAKALEAKVTKLAHPADAGDPFAGMGTPDKEEW